MFVVYPMPDDETLAQISGRKILIIVGALSLLSLVGWFVTRRL